MRNKKNKSAADEFDDNRSCCKYYRRWEPLLNESPVVLLMPNRSDYYAALRHFLINFSNFSFFVSKMEKINQVTGFGTSLYP